MAPTSCFTGQVHYLPDAPEAYGAMITRAKAAPGQNHSAARVITAPAPCAYVSAELENLPRLSFSHQ